MTWTTPNNLKTGRSTLFGPLLNTMFRQLETRIDEDETYGSLDEYLQMSRTGSLILLRQLFEALELDTIWDYIETFVEEFSV